MALSFSRRYGTTGMKHHVLDVTFDSSYPTGGESLTAANLGFTGKPFLVVAIPNGGYTFDYDYANEKLKAYTSGGTEVTDTTNLSAVTAYVFVWSPTI